jgi:glyoxylate/hydroxypyruvate reductase
MKTFVRGKNEFTMKKILITRLLPPATQQRLSQLPLHIVQWKSLDPIPRDYFIDQSRDCDGLLIMLTDRVDKEFLATTRTKFISTMSVGMDHIDVLETKRRGIQVFNTPDVLTDATAELGVALILTLIRRIPAAMEQVKTGGWKTWDPLWMCGQQLTGKTIGIVGMGRIGQGLADRLLPFQVKIVYTSRTNKQCDFTYVSFDELIQQSDIVILSCALNESTRHLVNRDVLQRMKRSSVLINIARGGIIKQEDLVEAMEKEWIAGCGLDVTDPEPMDPLHPLVTKFGERVVVFPHIGSATVETREAMASLALDQLLKGLQVSQ